MHQNITHRGECFVALHTYSKCTLVHPRVHKEYPDVPLCAQVHFLQKARTILFQSHKRDTDLAASQRSCLHTTTALATLTDRTKNCDVMHRLHTSAPRALSTRARMPSSNPQALPPPPRHLVSPCCCLQYLQPVLLHQHRRRPRPHSPTGSQPQQLSSLRLLHPATPF